MVKDLSVAGGFGRALRGWRSVRGISQLDLAVVARTTPRHVSFVETGRSRPGTELVLRLADALAVPLRERNDLLAMAGLPPAYPGRGLDQADLLPVRAVLDRVMRAHEPYPGWVIVGRGLRFLQATAGAERLFPGLVGMEPSQVIDAWFGPGPFRERVANWADVVRATLTTLRREALVTADPRAAELLHRAEAHVRGLPASPDSGGATAAPVACPTLILDGGIVRTVTTVLRFESATEVTTSELRVELMFPADGASETVLRGALEC